MTQSIETQIKIELTQYPQNADEKCKVRFSTNMSIVFM